MAIAFDYLTSKEAAATLRISVATLNRLIVSGRVPPPIKLGYRTRRWRRADLHDHLAARAGAANIDMILGLAPMKQGMK